MPLDPPPWEPNDEGWPIKVRASGLYTSMLKATDEGRFYIRVESLKNECFWLEIDLDPDTLNFLDCARAFAMGKGGDA